MSRATHPLARRIADGVGPSTRLLAVVMGLPLVDGIFASLVLSGSLHGALGVVEVGLLVFGGSATLTTVVSAGGTTRDRARAVLVVGVPLVALAAAEAALAPTLATVLSLPTFERFAAVVLITVAASAASARVREYLPGPGVVVALGLVASLDPAGAALVVRVDPWLVARGAAAAGVGVVFALSVVALRGHLDRALDADRFTFGCAVALGVLGLSVLGLVPSDAPLAVLAVAALLSVDPDASRPASGVADEGEPLAPRESETARTPDDDARGSDVARAPWL